MGFLLVVAVMFLAVMVGRFSVQIHKYNKTCEDLRNECAAIRHDLDTVDETVNRLLWTSATVDQTRAIQGKDLQPA